MGFGGSKQGSHNESQQTSQSFNQAYPFLQGALGEQVTNTGKSSSVISSLLGLNGSAEGANAFNTFRDSSGYDFVRDQGIRGLQSNKAAAGTLGSGSALKAIAGYSSNLAKTYLNDYLQQLMGLNSSGMQAGQILASAGNTASSQGTSFGTSTGKSSNISLS